MATATTTQLLYPNYQPSLRQHGQNFATPFLQITSTFSLLFSCCCYFTRSRRTRTWLPSFRNPLAGTHNWRNHWAHHLQLWHSQAAVPLLLSLSLAVGLLFPPIPSLPVSCSHQRPRKLYLWLKKEKFRYKRWKAIANIAKMKKKKRRKFRWLCLTSQYNSKFIRKKCTAGRGYFCITAFFLFLATGNPF